MRKPRLPDKFYQPLDECVAKSMFWEYENFEDDIIDGQVAEGLTVTQTFAAQFLSEVLTSFFYRSNFPISVVVRSPDIDDNPDYFLTAKNKFYGNRFILGGEMGVLANGKLLMYLNMAVFDDENFSVGDFDLFKAVTDMTAIIRHELVHAMQYISRSKNQGVSRIETWRRYNSDGSIADPKDLSMYYSSPLEIDAYAHEFAERILREHGIDKTLNFLRYGPNSFGAGLPRLLIDFLDSVDDAKKVNRLFGKIYSNVIDMNFRELFKNDDKLIL